MNSKTFEEIYEKWENKESNERFWNEELANNYGFSSPEALRSSFRRHRKTIEKGNKKQHNHTTYRILLWDVETSPIQALVWGMWEQNVNPAAILQDWHLLSWSAKWLFDDKVYSDVLTSKEAKRHDDKRIVKSAWDMLDQADVLVAHNGDKFDMRKINTRFLYHNMPPISHYKSVDTLKVAKYNFSFTSNALDFINNYLGIEQKEDVSFELWKKAYFGDEEALETLKKYNENDSYILEELFLRLRPFIKNIPNMNLYTDELTTVCRNCGSDDIKWSGYYYTTVNRYKGWRCNDCGAIGRSRFSDLDKEKRQLIVY